MSDSENSYNVILSHDNSVPFVTVVTVDEEENEIFNLIACERKKIEVEMQELKDKLRRLQNIYDTTSVVIQNK
jgi:hypothetical protein